MEKSDLWKGVKKLLLCIVIAKKLHKIFSFCLEKIEQI